MKKTKEQKLARLSDDHVKKRKEWLTEELTTLLPEPEQDLYTQELEVMKEEFIKRKL